MVVICVTTGAVADRIVEATGAATWRIEPEVAYTSEDLNYKNDHRSVLHLTFQRHRVERHRPAPSGNSSRMERGKTVLWE